MKVDQVFGISNLFAIVFDSRALTV